MKGIFSRVWFFIPKNLQTYRKITIANLIIISEINWQFLSYFTNLQFY